MPPATPAEAKSPAARKNTIKVRKRRIEQDDVNVVDKPTLKTAMGGTLVGNFMEWYDVGVYGYLAVTMGRLFLPEGSEAAQSLFGLATFAVTFIARPLGGVVFGHFGDKIGRQKILALTLIMMAASTAIIGILPTAATWGVWATGILILLKLIQGFSTGGEYAGATTFVSEYAPDKKRGFFASFLDLGSYLGFASGALLVTLLEVGLGEETMLAWGWRIPFLVAIPLGASAIYFRLKIEESPAYAAALDQAEARNEDAIDPKMTETGTKGVLKHYWREILVAFTLVAAANTAGYALTSYMPTYLTESLGYDVLKGTAVTVPVLVAMALLIPFGGKLSDKIGRRPVLWLASGLTIVLAIPAFMLMQRGEVWATALGLGMMALSVLFYVANLASALPAQFPTASRYAGMGIAYNLAVAIFGGTAGLIMESLIQATGNTMMPAYWLMATSVVGAIAVIFLKESANRPLPGSMPSVETDEEAREIVENQVENENIDHDLLPLDVVPVRHPDALPADSAETLEVPLSSMGDDVLAEARTHTAGQGAGAAGGLGVDPAAGLGVDPDVDPHPAAPRRAAD
ncbi:MFS transporter [Falsarthrobacter nasiphocae]|uniref:Putative proline/betaine transporter n=1 Tax=Falsarthrobacter nasiphocae TaxID=189863 RepID=A0AAE4C8C2_9MICC|nr:MFS transporter [Falsarthrobacter nasiphocae]MDR6892255.1 MHS family proline/betaine transporter-like MFS transporter [Falsarthrobacter nasiphocae]